MSYARQMLDTYPRTADVDAGLLAAAIDAASDCAQACTADTGADLNEPNLADMVTCIRLCLDCTDICTATVGVLSRLAGDDPAATRLLLEACAAICQSCGDECERHAHMPHCQVCAEACRRCERACRDLLDAWRLPVGEHVRAARWRGRHDSLNPMPRMAGLPGRMMGLCDPTQTTSPCCRRRAKKKPAPAGMRLPSRTMTSACARTARRTGTSEPELVSSDIREALD
jgi:hypothetical protein